MKTLSKLLLSAIFLTAPLLTLHADNVKYLTTEEFMKLFLNEERTEFRYNDTVPCIIDFYTTWCGPCKMLAPVMATLSDQYKGKVRFYKMDTEKELTVAAMFGINSIPQIFFVPLNNKPQMLKGYRTQEVLEAIINEYLLK